jgi:uncharacterized tellurite resistance protein B-like protein
MILLHHCGELKHEFMQLQQETILTGHTEREKGAYLAALASLATADRRASEDELNHLREIAKSAGLSPQQEEFIVHSATDISGEDLKKCLDVLRTSDLRYSLITDLIALAKADENYTEDEQANIEKIANYLDVDSKQVSVLDQFVSKAAEKAESPEALNKPGFLDSLGLRDKFSNAGFNMGSMGRGLMGMLGPMLLGGIAARALGGRRTSMGGGGLGGGLLGGMLGGVMGSNRMGMGGMGGGLGSLLNGLNRSRNNRSMGGLLGRLM